MVRPAILIVDDEKGVQTSLQGILEDAGFEAQAVSSGEDALDLLLKREFSGYLAAGNRRAAGAGQNSSDFP